MKKQDWIFSGGLAVIVALALALLCSGCSSVDQSWRPQPGDSYTAVHAKLDPGTMYIQTEGNEERWWLGDPRTTSHWIWYAKYDRPVVNVRVITAGKITQEVPSEAVLVDFGDNQSGALREREPVVGP